MNRHRTIRMKPNEVNSHNEQELRDTVYNYNQLASSASTLASSAVVIANGRELKLQKRKAMFKVGDYVRLSKYRTTFERGYTPNWTTEIFTIRKIQYNTDPITYLLNDYQNNQIKGSVYAEELQRVKHPNVYLVEKILRRRDGKVYVKWLGFGSEHNSWIPENDII